MESDRSLSAACRAVELRTQDVNDLATLELPVVLEHDFDSLSTLESIRLSPTIYRREDRRILVNLITFPSLSPVVAEAALAHEVGHAICQRDSIMEQPLYSPLNECMVADLFACKWGFFDGLMKERVESHGPEYCEILSLWSNEAEFVRRMTAFYPIWLTRRLVQRLAPRKEL